MREQLLALEKKMRDNIYEFAEENSGKPVEEILAMLGLEYTLKDGVYSFTASEIDTRELIYMTYDGMWLNVHNTRDGKPTGIESSFYCPTGKELIIDILFATTYSNKDESRCYNKLQLVEFDSYGNLVIKIGKDVCSW